MIQQIIPAYLGYTLGKPSKPHLNISEFYCDTIQGEGIQAGAPATFLRLQHCTMNCKWCDSDEVWKTGNPFTIDEVLELINHYKLADKWKSGQHLVLTGGSPLLQQNALILLIDAILITYGFIPFIEIENECTIIPKSELIPYISCWNNSPKLASNGILAKIRYKPEVLKVLSILENSWFKFVIAHEGEWKEIDEFYLKPGLICKSQIILMPEGATRAELEKNSEMVVNMAAKYSVRYSDRLHIRLWGRKVGV